MHSARDNGVLSHTKIVIGTPDRDVFTRALMVFAAGKSLPCVPGRQNAVSPSARRSSPDLQKTYRNPFALTYLAGNGLMTVVLSVKLPYNMAIW